MWLVSTILGSTDLEHLEPCLELCVCYSYHSNMESHTNRFHLLSNHYGICCGLFLLCPADHNLTILTAIIIILGHFMSS